MEVGQILDLVNSNKAMRATGRGSRLGQVPWNMQAAFGLPNSVVGAVVKRESF